MFNHVGLMADDSWNEYFALGQLHVLPDHPLVLVPRVCRLDRVGLGVDAQDHVDDVLKRDVARVRRVHASPAKVVTYSVFWDALQRVVVHLYLLFGCLTQLFPGWMWVSRQ